MLQRLQGRALVCDGNKAARAGTIAAEKAAWEKELDDWTANEDKTAERITRTPGLTRDILGSPTVSFNEDRSLAFVDFVWVETVGGVERDRRRKVLTLEFGLAPVKRTEEDADNPLGIAITHITLNDLVSSK